MNMHEENIKMVQDIINADRDNPIEIECSVMVQDHENGKDVYPGIQFNIPGVEIPIFIASGELMMLAEASEFYCKELMINQQKSKNVEKKKKL